MNRLKDVLAETRQTWLAKRYVMMKIAAQGFTVDSYLKEKQMAMLDALDEKKPRQRKEREYTHDVSFRMFAQGMTMAQIAQERSIAVSTVFSHLAHFVEAGTLDIQTIIPQDRLQAIERIVNMVPDVIDKVTEVVGKVKPSK